MENNKQEDLDILWVLRGVQKFISSFIELVKWLVDFTLKKFVYIAIFVVTGISIGIALSKIETPYYSSQMVVAHTRLENDYCREIISDLNSFVVTDSNNPSLASTLSVSTNYAKYVKSFTFSVLHRNNPKDKTDSTFLLHPFKIEVEVYDNMVLDTLQKALIQYLESNGYATARKQADLNSMQNFESHIQNELKELDSLKLLVNQGIIPRGSGTGIILGEPINPISVYKQSMELFEKQLEIRKKISINNSFEAVVNFAKNPMPKNNFKSLYILGGGFLGYLIGMLYLIRRGSRKKQPNNGLS